MIADGFRDAQGQIKDLSRQVQELLAIRSHLEAERDSLASELSDTRDALKDAQARLEAATASLTQLKIDFEHRLRTKDEEIESARFVCTHILIFNIHEAVPFKAPCLILNYGVQTFT